MLRKLIGPHFSASAEQSDAQDSRPRQRDDASRDENAWSAGQEAQADSWANEDAGPDEDENDWDEYDDEIASAAAFSAWQDASVPQRVWNEDEAALAAELQEAHDDAERWEDWAAVDDIEDDASYEWGQEEEEEY